MGSKWSRRSLRHPLRSRNAGELLGRLKGRTERIVRMSQIEISRKKEYFISTNGLKEGIMMMMAVVVVVVVVGL